MNVVRPIAPRQARPPRRSALSTCDIHPRVRDLSEFRPFLTEAMPGTGSSPTASARARLRTRATPSRRRRRSPAGGMPGRRAAGRRPPTCAFLQQQLLDRYGMDVGVLNPLQPSGQGDQNDGLSVAMPAR
jgi:uncharacterized protein